VPGIVFGFRICNIVFYDVKLMYNDNVVIVDDDDDDGDKEDRPSTHFYPNVTS